ncbi:hypothetical protein [Pseudomonas mandelii]|uniref:hypothetical protein n=1 Tax=Pseudomonas mandelii TaxID=75612 RepID=UPI0013763FBB|nr:hypothetical protein [Pseudomonas mandelii]
MSILATRLAKIDAALIQGLAGGVNNCLGVKKQARNKQGFASAFARKPLILDGAEAGIEPFLLLLKIKGNF